MDDILSREEFGQSQAEMWLLLDAPLDIIGGSAHHLRPFHHYCALVERVLPGN